MNIKSPAEDKITVELTEQDLLELEITYEDMDYSTTETRRVIWTLLDEARKVLGREIDPSGRMIIEALPSGEGGCVLNFTILESRKRYQPQKQLLRKHPQNILCEFDCFESLCKAVETIGNAGCTESSLYENGGKYRLMLKCSGNPLTVKNLLSEFGFASTLCPLSRSFTKEHWRELIAQDAVITLNKPSRQDSSGLQ